MTEKLTDEQLRDMSDGEVRRYDSPGWAEPVNMMARTILALRAERAKPTHSDVERARDALAFHGQPVDENQAYAVVRLIASIRAEGSAERAKLEGQIRQHREQISRLQDTIMKLKDDTPETLAQPAERGATLDALVEGITDENRHPEIRVSTVVGAKP